MLCAVNRALYRQRRRTAAVAAVVALAGAVATAHSAMNHDHMSGAVVACLAVVETAVAVAGTLALGAQMRTHRAVPLARALPDLALVISVVAGRSRADPRALQVFRL